jgi:hypothetical protein
MELCIRAWRLNWKCYYENNAVCKRKIEESVKNHEATKLTKSVNYLDLYYLHAIHLNGFALTAWYFQITIVDLLPKLFTGQSWIWKSYKELFVNRKLIKQYKEKVKNLLEGKENNGTIFNIAHKIQLSVTNKRPIRLKNLEL